MHVEQHHTRDRVSSMTPISEDSVNVRLSIGCSNRMPLHRNCVYDELPYQVMLTEINETISVRRLNSVLYTHVTF